MKIKMELLSDAIFGNGMSIPGGEDTSVTRDEYGFPYYKGATFKGVFREEFERYLEWIGKNEMEIIEESNRLFGKSGSDDENGKLIFSDFELSPYVKQEMLSEIGNDASLILDVLSNIRSFTAIDNNGVAKEGSLRLARCVNKGLFFYSEIECDKKDEKLLKAVLANVKWVGTKRNRGFGKVKIWVEEE